MDTTRDDAALPKWPFRSALPPNHLYLLTLYLIPNAQRMTVRYLFLFFFFFGHIKCLIVSSIMRYFLGIIVLRICHLTETRAMGTVQYDGSRPYTFKAKRK